MVKRGFASKGERIRLILSVCSLISVLSLSMVACGSSGGHGPKSEARTYSRIADGLERDRQRIEGPAIERIGKTYAACPPIQGQLHSADGVLDRYGFWTVFRLIAPAYHRAVARLEAARFHEPTLLQILAQAKIIDRTLQVVRRQPLPPICEIVDRYLKTSDEGGFLLAMDARYIPLESERAKAGARLDETVPKLMALLRLTFWPTAQTLVDAFRVGTP
jgi:hypothetical protein